MSGVRKAAGSEVRMGTALKTAGICMFIVSAAVGYVRQSHEISALKIGCGRLEQDWQRLRSHNAEQRRALMDRHTHASIERELLRHRSDLVPARLGQVVIVSATRREHLGRSADHASRLSARANRP